MTWITKFEPAVMKDDLPFSCAAYLYIIIYVMQRVGSLGTLVTLNSVGKGGILCMSNSTGNCAVSIALRVLLIPNSTGYPCYHSLIVGHLHCSYTVSFTHYLHISGVASSGTSFST